MIDHGKRFANPEPEFAGYTFAALHDAFELVRDPADWKAPINATILLDNVSVVDCAISFFTATEPIFISAQNGLVRVEADGYRDGPAGP